MRGVEGIVAWARSSRAPLTGPHDGGLGSSACTLIAAAALLVAGCHDSTSPGGPRGEVTVLTRNLYVGSPLDAVLAAPSPAEIPARVAALWAAVQASNYPERAEALANEIQETEPDLVGLQEVALWRIQSPGDNRSANPTPATAIAIDFLGILLTELAERGLSYVATVSTGSDVELPSATGDDIRLTDREVILVRAGVATSNPQEGHFTTNLSGPVGGVGGPMITIRRGWASVEVSRGGDAFQFVSTHLETEIFSPIQVAQAAELLQVLSDVALPVVLVGDFNSAADRSSTPTYGNLLEAGFTDAWSEAMPDSAGLTCCQRSDLRNAASTNSKRIDLILHTGEFTAVNGDVLGDAPMDRTSSGLWPSDHSGVVATLRLP